MGLLDAFNDPTQMGLLNAGAQILQQSGNTRQPYGLGQAMGTGITGFMQGQQAGRQQQQQQAEFEQQQQAHALQMAAVKRQQDEQKAIDEAARASMTGGGLDTQAFVQRMMQISPMKGMELQKQLAKSAPEFYGDVKTGKDKVTGEAFQYILDKQGNQKRLDGTMPRDQMSLANLGGKDIAYNPYDLKPGQEFARTQTPDSVASNASAAASRAQAERHFGVTSGMAQERLGIDRQEAATKATVGKAPTEFQGKSAAFGLRATEADKILNSIAGKYNPAAINSKQAVEDTWLVGGALGSAANKYLLGKDDQLAEQAQRDFVNAVLRQESGAAIGPTEFQNAKKQYFPQPGDSPEVIAQKANNRQLAIQGFDNNAGRAKMTAPEKSAVRKYNPATGKIE